MSTEADPRARIRRAVGSAAATLLVVGLAVVAVSRTSAGGAAVADVATRAHPGPLLLAVALVAAAFGPLTLRWRALMDRRPPVVGLAVAWCTGQLLTLTVPGPVGELGAAWLAHRRFDVGFAGALASAVAGRIAGLGTAAALACVTWAAFELPVPAAYRPAVAASAVAMGVGGALLGWLAARPRWWTRLVEVMTSPLADRLPGPVARVRSAVSALADALATVATAGAAAWGAALGWAVASHLLLATGVWVLLAGLGDPVAPHAVLFALCGAVAATVVAFLLPGSQLAFDGILVALLAGAAGVAVRDAAAAALLLRGTQVAVMIVAALVTAWLPLPPGRDASAARPPR